MPADAGAQDDEISFPPAGDRNWEGLVNFAGFLSSDNVAEDGSFSTTITDVIDDTTIYLKFVVNSKGQVTSGTMEVSGNAARLVASGTLRQATNTVADGYRVEEISGAQDREVEWVFGAIEANCVRVTAELIETSGISLMGTSRANEIHDRDFPQAANLLELVDLWSKLNAELAKLDECQTTIVGWVPQSTRSWLVTVLRRALDKAVENQDTYDAQELIDLWDAGMHEQAMNADDLWLGLLDAIGAKLNEAIAGETADTPSSASDDTPSPALDDTPPVAPSGEPLVEGLPMVEVLGPPRPGPVTLPNFGGSRLLRRRNTAWPCGDPTDHSGGGRVKRLRSTLAACLSSAPRAGQDP